MKCWRPMYWIDVYMPVALFCSFSFFSFYLIYLYCFLPFMVNRDKYILSGTSHFNTDKYWRQRYVKRSKVKVRRSMGYGVYDARLACLSSISAPKYSIFYSSISSSPSFFHRLLPYAKTLTLLLTSLSRSTFLRPSCCLNSSLPLRACALKNSVSGA